MSRDLCFECKSFHYCAGADGFTDDCTLFEPSRLPEEATEPRKGLCVECAHYLSAFRTCSVGPAETCNRNWPNARCKFTPSRWWTSGEG